MTGFQLMLSKMRGIRTWCCRVAIPVLSVFSAGCCFSASATTLEGIAFYRERMVLPADAVFEAVLEDVSRVDVPAEVLGRVRLDPAGNPPFRFAIRYDERTVKPGHRSVVRATITHQKHLLFTTSKSYPVLAGGHAPLEMLLVSARQVPRQPSAPIAESIDSSNSDATEFTGLFTYMADAAMITLCSGNRKLPVAMEGDYRALESAYLQQRRQPDDALFVQVEGLIVLRPSNEEDAPDRPTFVVNRFVGLPERSGCGNSRSDSPLRNTNWKLKQLGDKPAMAANGNRQEPHLIFAADPPRISGSGGCNRIMGRFETDGDKLSFSQLAGTMMACLNGMEQEHQFLESLKEVQSYRISGGILELLDEAGNLVARFEAVALR